MRRVAGCDVRHDRVQPAGRGHTECRLRVRPPTAPEIELSEAELRHLALRLQPDRRLVRRKGLGAVAELVQRDGEVVLCLDQTWLQSGRFGERGDRLIEPSCSAAGKAQVVMHLGYPWIDP